MARKDRKNPFTDLAESLNRRGVNLEDRVNSLGTGYEKRSMKSLARFLAIGVALLGVGYFVVFLTKMGFI